MRIAVKRMPEGLLLCLRALALGLGIVLSSGGNPTALDAKGPIDKITVSRVAWENPVEVTAGDALNLLSPWRYDFVGNRLRGQPDGAGVSIGWGSQVWIYVRTSDGVPAPARPGLRGDPSGLKLVYYVDYYPDLSDSTPGFIHLPGETPTASLNNSTIIRATGWYEATPAWKDLMVALSGPVRPPSTGDGGLVGE